MEGIYIFRSKLFLDTTYLIYPHPTASHVSNVSLASHVHHPSEKVRLLLFVVKTQKTYFIIGWNVACRTPPVIAGHPKDPEESDGNSFLPCYYQAETSCRPHELIQAHQPAGRSIQALYMHENGRPNHRFAVLLLPSSIDL